MIENEMLRFFTIERYSSVPLLRCSIGVINSATDELDLDSSPVKILSVDLSVLVTGH